jgi:hypothetical protein
MSNFSNDSINKNTQATFKKFHVYEVASNLTDAKSIASTYSETHKYQHRAKVVVAGTSSIRPYDPIYLDGLPNGMSGYWVVLSVKHVFGGKVSRYILELEVGTDTIGEIDDDAEYRSNNRNILADLSGQSLTPSDTGLTTYSEPINANSLQPTQYGPIATSAVASSPIAVPTVEGATPYADSPPNLGNIKNPVQWTAKSSGKVVM